MGPCTTMWIIVDRDKPWQVVAMHPRIVAILVVFRVFFKSRFSRAGAIFRDTIVIEDLDTPGISKIFKKLHCISFFRFFGKLSMCWIRWLFHHKPIFCMVNTLLSWKYCAYQISTQLEIDSWLQIWQPNWFGFSFCFPVDFL